MALREYTRIMGGMKKKPVGSSDKTAAASDPTSDVKSTKEDSSKKTGSKAQQKQKLSVYVEESQGMKALQGMKAITIHAFARATGVKISVANTFIKSLEAKGLVKSVGGNSGHRVYKLAKQ
jgi:small subunit ribosomal protein S25e